MTEKMLGIISDAYIDKGSRFCEIVRLGNVYYESEPLVA
jgi:hypothetical protein